VYKSWNYEQAVVMRPQGPIVIENTPDGVNDNGTPRLEMLPGNYSPNRKERIVSELRIAMRDTSTQDLAAWSYRSSRYLAGSGMRRAGNLWSMLGSAGGALKNEYRYITESPSFKKYISDRSDAAADQWRTLRKSSALIWRQLNTYCKANPVEAGSRLVLLCFGFHVGSGGLDGDGGIPDLDWTLFDSHRSIFTHSIIAGMVVEVSVASLVDLISTIHGKLPNDHDPIWDSIKAGSTSLELFALGASAGIAYHLGIDATIDGDGKYMDLPFSTTQEVHQAIAATNAMAEGLDAVARLSRWGDTVATYGQLTDAREAIMTTDTPSSFVIQRLDHDKGFRITWRPRRTPKPA
jgi:hypothetical protein